MWIEVAHNKYPQAWYQPQLPLELERFAFKVGTKGSRIEEVLYFYPYVQGKGKRNEAEQLKESAKLARKILEIFEYAPSSVQQAALRKLRAT